MTVRKRDMEGEDPVSPGAGGDGMIRMGQVVDTVSELCSPDAVIVSDVGQNQMFAARYSRFGRSGRWVTSGGLGTMGFGLPAAIGAQMANPGRQVIVFVGDGGFQMTDLISLSLPQIYDNGVLSAYIRIQFLWRNRIYTLHKILLLFLLVYAWRSCMQKKLPRQTLGNLTGQLLKL